MVVAYGLIRARKVLPLRRVGCWNVQASLVVNSLSKYIGGHGHALGGAVTNTGLYDWSDYDIIAQPYRKDRRKPGG